MNPCYEAYLSAFDIIEKMRTRCASTCPVQLIAELIPFLEEQLGSQTASGKFEISLSPKKWSGSQIFGALKRYQESAEIIYSLDLNTCWRRFVIAKELAHLLFDDNRTYTQDPVALVGNLLSGFAAADGPTAEFTSEKLAAIMAIELLLPQVERPKIKALAQAGHSVRKIGVTYRVPAKVVETFLSPEYENMAESCWSLRK